MIATLPSLELAAAVMGRHVDFGVGSITSYYALSLAGKVRTLAVAVDRLVEVAAQVAQSPEFAMRIGKIGGIIPSMSPAQFAAMIRAEQRTAATMAARLGIVQSDR